MYSPIIHWGNRGELPHSSIFYNNLEKALKGMTSKEIYNMLPEKYKGKIIGNKI